MGIKQMLFMSFGRTIYFEFLQGIRKSVSIAKVHWYHIFRRLNVIIVFINRMQDKITFNWTNIIIYLS